MGMWVSRSKRRNLLPSPAPPPAAAALAMASEVEDGRAVLAASTTVRRFSMRMPN